MTLLCFENEQPTAELARATVLQGRRNNEDEGEVRQHKVTGGGQTMAKYKWQSMDSLGLESL